MPRRTLSLALQDQCVRALEHLPQTSRHALILVLETLLSAADHSLDTVRLRRVPPDYSAIWPHLEEDLIAQVADLKDEGHAEALADLLQLSEDRRLAFLKTSPRFRSVRLAWLLLDRCGETASRDPREAEQLAHLALGIASDLEPRHESASLKADLIAHAWGLIGDARRRRCDWCGAEEAFKSAQTALAASVDPLEEASFCQLLALLRAEQGRFIERTALEGWARALLKASGQLLCDDQSATGDDDLL